MSDEFDHTRQSFAMVVLSDGKVVGQFEWTGLTGRGKTLSGQALRGMTLQLGEKLKWKRFVTGHDFSHAA